MLGPVEACCWRSELGVGRRVGEHPLRVKGERSWSVSFVEGRLGLGTFEI